MIHRLLIWKQFNGKLTDRELGCLLFLFYALFAFLFLVRISYSMFINFAFFTLIAMSVILSLRQNTPLSDAQ